ncbi:MAG: DUF371 domain-containing protein [Candidatus Bathyarchaeota archaeon]|nr:MAG: DUF371 domain-containing protein [Candidatus Bathyarchaeota archaeon]
MRVDFEAWGHKNILGMHSSTLEITKSRELTKRGTCVVGVRATMALSDLSEEFRNLARNGRSRITVSLFVGGLEEKITGWGNSQLTLQHPGDIVVRKSQYVCDRTLCIGADRAACDLSREMMRLLGNPDQIMTVSLSVERH